MRISKPSNSSKSFSTIFKFSLVKSLWILFVRSIIMFLILAIGSNLRLRYDGIYNFLCFREENCSPNSKMNSFWTSSRVSLIQFSMAYKKKVKSSNDIFFLRDLNWEARLENFFFHSRIYKDLCNFTFCKSVKITELYNRFKET